MNRRSFIGSVLKACVAPMVLPAAVTYGRIWTPPREIVTMKIVDFWFETYRYERRASAAYEKAFVKCFFFQKRIPDWIEGEWRDGRINAPEDIGLEGQGAALS